MRLSDPGNEDHHHEILDAERNDRTVAGIERAPLRVHRVRLSDVKRWNPGLRLLRIGQKIYIRAG